METHSCSAHYLLVWCPSPSPSAGRPTGTHLVTEGALARQALRQTIVPVGHFTVLALVLALKMRHLNIGINILDKSISLACTAYFYINTRK